MIKNTILGIVTIAVLVGCSSNGTVETKEVQAIPVKVQKLKKTNIARTLEYMADLKAFEEVYYAPSSPGRIEQINVEVGDRIKKGDVLVVMDQTNLHQAKVQLKNAEAEYNRAKMLNETQSISKQQYDMVEANYEVAKSNVDFLTENTKLMAPFNGVVTGKYYENGELYSGSPAGGASKAAVIRIEQINPLKAYVNMTERYFPMLKPGMKLEFKSNIYPDKVFNGTVNIVYPTIDNASRTFTVEVKIPNDDQVLRPGMSGTIDFFVGEAEGMIVPTLSVLKLQGANNRYVFINKNGRAKRVDVALGRRFDGEVEIISNQLKEGDELIVVGQGRLVDGTAISVTPNNQLAN